MLSTNIRKNSENDIFQNGTCTDLKSTGTSPTDMLVRKIGNIVNIGYRKALSGMTGNGNIMSIPLEFAPVINTFILGFAHLEASGDNPAEWFPIFIQVERGGTVNFYLSSTRTIDQIVFYGAYGC